MLHECQHRFWHYLHFYLHEVAIIAAISAYANFLISAGINLSTMYIELF